MAVVPLQLARVEDPELGQRRLVLVDSAIVAAMLGLTFLLGCFPNKDVDFWWHLRTGDYIRAEGRVPSHDLYTYTVAENPWIDLHWGFQLLLSLGYEQIGIVGLNLAKCVVTTLAVFLLLTAKRREWPYWVMAAAWVPALVLLGGRMYIRPETLTLLYVACFLAVLVRWDARPRLAYLLPIVQVAWVNSQGLFVFGPIILAFAGIDALTRLGWRTKDARRWWRIVLPACVLTALACLVNPYGLWGALYPLTLLSTMGNEVFTNSIGELTSIPKLIADNAGRIVFMLRVQIVVTALATLSFVGPIAWMAWTRVRGRSAAGSAVPAKKGRRKATKVDTVAGSWRISVFRLLLFAAFTGLSLQATRNSHQFAAIVGALTAWNLGEWAAAIRARRAAEATSTTRQLIPRLASLGLIAATIAVVGTGTLYRWAGEKRTIGLGDEPAWFPHEAVAFAGSDGLPPRFLGFHLGHAALFIHKYGPERKVFADPRLEVMKAEQYQRYLNLQKAINNGEPAWSGKLEAAGRPVVLVDHEFASVAGVGMLTEPTWPCIWFGPVAAVFAHERDARSAGIEPVDFLARHYGRQAPPQTASAADAISVARGLNAYVLRLTEQRGRLDLAGRLIPAGLDAARRARAMAPRSVDPWAIACTLELCRDRVGASPTPRRPGEPFDPLFDLSAARITHAGRRALEIEPDHAMTMTSLAGAYQMRGLDEAALPLLDQLARRDPKTPGQRDEAAIVVQRRDELARKLGRAPKVERANGNEVERSIRRLIESGRVESAALLIEEQFPAGERSWPIADQLATLWLSLGRPERARDAWKSADGAAPAGIALSRIAATYYAEDALDAAREAYRAALARDEGLFETLYGLALVESDAGDAGASLAAARRALNAAPTDLAKARVRAIVRQLEPYAR